MKAVITLTYDFDTQQIHIKHSARWKRLSAAARSEFLAKAMHELSSEYLTITAVCKGNQK